MPPLSVIGEYHAVPDEADVCEATAAKLCHCRSSHPATASASMKWLLYEAVGWQSGSGRHAWLASAVRNTETAAVPAVCTHRLTGCRILFATDVFAPT